MDTLTGETYDSANAKKWTINIANEVNAKVRGKYSSLLLYPVVIIIVISDFNFFSELKMKRYKHIAQVIIGELKGAGVKCGVRCLWDSETDGYTSDIFMNVSINDLSIKKQNTVTEFD